MTLFHGASLLVSLHSPLHDLLDMVAPVGLSGGTLWHSPL